MFVAMGLLHIMRSVPCTNGTVVDEGSCMSAEKLYLHFDFFLKIADAGRFILQ